MCLLTYCPPTCPLHHNYAEPASLSKPLNGVEPPPRLFHSLHQQQNSVLSLAADASHIYSGSQGEGISVSLSFKLVVITFWCAYEYGSSCAHAGMGQGDVQAQNNFKRPYR